MYISFRYDLPENSEQPEDYYIDAIKKYIVANFMKYAIAYEIASETKKPHLQGKILIKKDKDTVRKNMKKDLGFFCRSNYSLAIIKEPEKYDSYICKDGKFIINNIFTEEYILEQVKKHNEIVEKYKEVQKLTFTQRVAKDYKEENKNCLGIIRQYSYSEAKVLELEIAHEDLLKYILKRLGKVVKCFDERELQRIYNGVKNSIIYENDDTLERAVQFFSKRIEL